jgi:glycosyltransferase involved in cell wall biosynthesis
MSDARPSVVVFTTVFPHPGQPGAGLFVRERVFRIGRQLPLTVVAPVPWFPLQYLVRRWRAHFRPSAPRVETQSGFEVLHPRFFSVPALFKWLDGWSLAICALPAMRRLKRENRLDLIDSHFAYPDGYAATLLGRWLGVPVTVTLRGTEVPISRTRIRRRMMIAGLKRAARVISVADALGRHVAALGVDAAKILVVGNGVDTDKFRALPRSEARRDLSIAPDAQVLISVGGLGERKGMHRVIECLPALRRHHPRIQYLIVGGASPEGDWGEKLRRQVDDLGLTDVVRFLGQVPPERLKVPLSASDVFVLATRNEGWANVFLEAMACGLPVVTTLVGGNAEVVNLPELGILVPYGDRKSLHDALCEALTRGWDTDRIVGYARNNSWDTRIPALIEEFCRIHRQRLTAKRRRAVGDLKA